MAITKKPNGSWLVSIYQPDKPRIRKTLKLEIKLENMKS